MSDDLIKRLKAARRHFGAWDSEPDPLAAEAADTIACLTRERDDARARFEQACAIGRVEQ